VGIDIRGINEGAASVQVLIQQAERGRFIIAGAKIHGSQAKRADLNVCVSQRNSLHISLQRVVDSGIEARPRAADAIAGSGY
jgi:hypothetical protein